MDRLLADECRLYVFPRRAVAAGQNLEILTPKIGGGEERAGGSAGLGLHISFISISFNKRREN